MALMLLRVLVAARLLQLDGFAQLSAGLLISSSFGMLSCLGVYAVLQRDMPGLLVRGQERRGAVLHAQAVALACALASMALVVAAAGWSVANMSTSVMVAGVVHGLTQQWFLLTTVESRSRGEPVRFALQMAVRSALVVLVGLGTLVFTRSPVLALLAEAMVTLMVALSITSSALRRARLGWVATARIGWRRIGAVPWGSALALMSVSLVTFVAQFSDRWIAAETLGTSAFALYSFAWTLPLIGQSIQAVVNAAAFPLVARRHATQGPERSFRISATLSLVAVVGGSVLILPANWLLDMGVRHWLPAYADATPLLTLFLVVTVLRISDFWTTYLTVDGHERALLLLNLGATGCAVAVWAWMKWPAGPDHDWRAIDVAMLAPMVAGTTYFCVAIAAWVIFRSRHRART